MNTTRQLPEAGASAAAKVVSQKGFHWLFTIRDTSGSALLPKLAAFEQTVQDLGWSPENGFFEAEPNGARKGGTSKGASGRQALEETSCAKCGAPSSRKGGMRKDKSWWEGVFCSAGDESHKVGVAQVIRSGGSAARRLGPPIRCDQLWDRGSLPAVIGEGQSHTAKGATKEEA